MRRSFFVVEHKSLFHNVLAIFRLDETATLKMANLLYDSYLRTTPKKKPTQKSPHKAKAQTAKLKDRAGIVGALHVDPQQNV